ncbi:N-acetylglucosamine-6-phosphate deacetylase [Fervidibacillus halotolerans]|uniref:N-acetylglucosamine-6-phosphate deacetylase n=1 Tax=Fervidibacillus halotolerans TaxID=2980027 RepID=A0A9E8LYL9_9BACI|nr:N-acetylglucosamine-6-phosphate deacetylase [Fervidibacillus halotolerans]WAA11961.1 N-acetylglucosamine-6-phosphate deacetylase [Fervidibacillus halotolerans]
MNRFHEPFVLTGNVCTDGKMLENQSILVENGTITSIGDKSSIPAGFNGEVINIPSPYVIAPGFIDIHIHGAGGADTMDATDEALETMANTLVKEGTTSFLATTITQKKEAIEKALENVATYMKEKNSPGQAEILGVHLEGPFINSKRKGAQPEEYILEPSIEQFDRWQEIASGTIKIVTMAPEKENGLDFVKHLTNTGVISSIGHSDANYSDVEKAVQSGASHITHLFNGMKGLHHREPGTAGGALLLDDLTVEIIADGFHIRPEMIDLAVRLKGLDRVILITDAMRAKWLPDGESELGGQVVIVKDGKATLTSGSLAGSILKMNQAVKNIMDFAQLSLPEAVKLATVNPAKKIGVDHRKGSIEIGKDADFVIIDEQIQPIMTITKGTIAFKGVEGKF